MVKAGITSIIVGIIFLIISLFFITMAGNFNVILEPEVNPTLRYIVGTVLAILGMLILAIGIKNR
jgi:hypothetical protein